MRHSHAELESKANAINNTKLFYTEIHVNRRNGYYAVDQYSWKDGKYLGHLQAGLTAKECYFYLLGFQEAFGAF